MIDNEFKPDWCLHPSVTIREIMYYSGMSINVICRNSYIDREYMEGIMSGNEPITEDIAKGLEEEIGIPSNMLMNMQRQYDILVTKDGIIDCTQNNLK